jgi:SAM-dependent methyltransferase
LGKTDFDEYADDYNQILEKQLSFFSEDKSYFAEYKVKLVRAHVQAEPQSILEFGCGIGRSMKYLRTYFPQAEISGCDISDKCLEVARKENEYAFFFNNGTDDSTYCYDLIVVANVFHHVSHTEYDSTIERINRYLNPNGQLFIFEHNPFNPVTRHLVKVCPFDSDAVLLYPNNMKRLIVNHGFNIINFKYTLFFPPKIGRIAGKLDHYLSWLPMGGQYFFQAVKS